MSRPARVLIVDDDVELGTLLSDYLSSEDFEIELAHDGDVGLTRARSGEHAMIVLDVMLPKRTGLEVLRESSRAPVLMLTARGDDVDRIVGLEMGADDYLGKPFNPRELAARLRAIHRRVRGDTGPPAELLRRAAENVVRNAPRGTVVATNADGGGLRVTIRLPAA